MSVAYKKSFSFACGKVKNTLNWRASVVIIKMIIFHKTVQYFSTFKKKLEADLESFSSNRWTQITFRDAMVHHLVVHTVIRMSYDAQIHKWYPPNPLNGNDVACITSHFKSHSLTAAYGRTSGCGWPKNLQLPRGKPDGMNFLLFVMVTDSSWDTVS